MLVPAPREARDQPRDLRQPAAASVVQETALAPARAIVVGVLLPEDEDVVRVAEGDAVPAQVVDLPGHARGVEQVEDDRVVEDAVSPDAVRGDSARRAGREVEAVRPGRPKQRAEEVPDERRVVQQAVVEGQLVGRVEADRRVAVADLRRRALVEAVHRPAVPLLMHRAPVVRRVGRLEARELERLVRVPVRVRLRVAGWRPEAGRLHLRRIAEVMVERSVLGARDDQVASGVSTCATCLARAAAGAVAYREPPRTATAPAPLMKARRDTPSRNGSRSPCDIRPALLARPGRRRIYARQRGMSTGIRAQRDDRARGPTGFAGSGLLVGVSRAQMVADVARDRVGRGCRHGRASRRFRASGGWFGAWWSCCRRSRARSP